MATTFVKIQTVTVGSGGSASIAFTSIPQTFTDLKIVLSARTNRNTGDATNIKVTLNGSTSGYTFRTLIGNGSVASSETQASPPFYTNAFFGGYANQNTGTTALVFSSHEIYVPNYTSANNKSVSVDSVNENNATAAYQVLSAGLWSNTAAITSVTFTPESTFTFNEYSTATLYGIKSS